MSEASSNEKKGCLFTDYWMRFRFADSWSSSQEMQRAAETVDVRTNVRRVRVLGLLRRDVIRRPHHAAGGREMGRRRIEPERASVRFVSVGILRFRTGR